MFIRDVMTTNVITIPSTTSLSEARRIMEVHGLRRLPVLDRGKLVGIISRDALDKAGPSKLTTFSIHELTYLLSKLTVSEVMRRDVVTVPPDLTVEEGVALAQSKHVGALLIMEDSHLVGIATTNDFFYKILNPILGIGEAGSRVHIHKCAEIPCMIEVLNVISNLGVDIITMYMMMYPTAKTRDLVVHLNTNDPSRVIEEVRKLGYEVHERLR